MAIVDDDMNEDSVYPNLVNSVNSNLGDEALSSEDLLWVNSCLIKDVDASDTDWSSIKDALFEILSSQQGPVDSSAAETSTQATADEDIHFRENVANPEFGSGSDEDEDLLDDEDVGDLESIEISDVSRNKKGRMRKKRGIVNAFRPNYTEDTEKVEISDFGMDLSLTTWEVENSSEDIFKVWDLGIPDEQDDFTKQINKAYNDVPLQIQPNPDDSTTLNDSMNVSVDDLVAGIGDLSLKQYTK